MPTRVRLRLSQVSGPGHYFAKGRATALGQCANPATLREVHCQTAVARQPRAKGVDKGLVVAGWKLQYERGGIAVVDPFAEDLAQVIDAERGHELPG